MNKTEEEEEDDMDIKVILVGETGTGKTSLINTSIGLEFQEKIESSQASSIIQKKMIINNKQYNINLWDTIGQEEYRSLTKIFMKDSKIVIFVYDITRLKSFELLEFWFNSTKEVLGDGPIIGIVGNKEDLYFQAKVTDDMIEEYSNKKGVPYQLTSAKTPKSFNDFLEKLVISYLEKKEGVVDNKKNDGIKLGKEKKPKKKKRWC